MVVQRTSAGQFAEHRTNAKLLLLQKEKMPLPKNVRRASSDAPQKFHEVTSLGMDYCSSNIVDNN